jgi:hypothetical protein
MLGEMRGEQSWTTLFGRTTFEEMQMERMAVSELLLNYVLKRGFATLARFLSNNSSEFSGERGFRGWRLGWA